MTNVSMEKLEVGNEIKFIRDGYVGGSITSTGIVISFLGTELLEVKYTGGRYGWCSIKRSEVVEVI